LYREGGGRKGFQVSKGRKEGWYHCEERITYWKETKHTPLKGEKKRCIDGDIGSGGGAPGSGGKEDTLTGGKQNLNHLLGTQIGRIHEFEKKQKKPGKKNAETFWASVIEMVGRERGAW